MNLIYTPEDLISAVHHYGIIPFFSELIPGFCLDDYIPGSVWDENYGLGPWMWRDEIAAEKTCIYGKFLKGKTAYVAKEWFPVLANYRRDGYDCDSRYDDGLMRHEDKVLFDLIEKNGPVTTVELKKLMNVSKGKTYGFESSLTRLQMLTYVVPCDFTFPRKADGSKKYSYGITWYDTPEHWFSEEYIKDAYRENPKDSFERLCSMLSSVMEDVPIEDIEKVLK